MVAVSIGRLNTTSLDNLGRYDLSLDQLKLYYANYPTSQQPYLTAYDYSKYKFTTVLFASLMPLHFFLPSVVLEKIRWPVLEGEKTLGNITKEAFIAFAKDILSTASVTCLAHGNVNKVQVEKGNFSLVFFLRLKVLIRLLATFVSWRAF